MRLDEMAVCISYPVMEVLALRIERHYGNLVRDLIIRRTLKFGAEPGFDYGRFCAYAIGFRFHF